MPPEEFEALLGTPRGLDVARVADLFGIAHRRVNDLADLPATLEVDMPLIEIAVDRRENLELHRRLNEAALAALAAPR
jgi:2-succinyl-5-enolpyruvyl-6-hydroxy-3-cyclohexene-1-carboxylate synthase